MPLPNFIILGPMKTGTTTLHSNLAESSFIEMSTSKEPNYFNANFSKPMKWYEEMFIGEREIIGEASPSYAKRHFYPDTAERIYNLLPNAKLIFIARDPIDRIISHLHHDLYRDRFKGKKADEVIFSNPDYIESSKYYYQIEPFLQFYDKKNLCLLSFNNLRGDLSGTLQKIERFLGIEKPYAYDNLKITNTSEKKFFIKEYDRMNRLLPNNLFYFYKLSCFLLSIKKRKPVLNNSSLIKIKEELYPDIVKYKQLTNSSFDDWRTFNKIRI